MSKRIGMIATRKSKTEFNELVSFGKGNKPYYPILESEISKSGVKKKDIADKLGLSPRALSSKLTGKTDFWLKEVLIIHSCFPNVPPMELFKH